jgi:hypothetical protein
MGDGGLTTLDALPESVQRELRWCYRHLEHPSFAARLSDVLASPFEEAMALLPKRWRKRMDRSAEANIQRVLALALRSMGSLQPRPAAVWRHKLAAAGAGAVGGFFGPLTVLAELPVTTALMLRAIADIARAEGEDLARPEARLACAQVFALGGRTRDDESAEIGYYGMRITLGLHFENVLEFAGAAEGPHIPAAIGLARAIAARFGVVVSDKTAAQLVPVAGAVSGMALNLMFMQHYQDVARGHFVVRRLEREYGDEVIRDAYRELEREEEAEEREFSPVVGW